MNSKQTIAIIGSILLIVGVFLPVISVPIFGTFNLFHNGQGDGTILLALAIFSVIFAVARMYEWLWVTGLCSLAVTLYDLVNAATVLSRAKGQMEQLLVGNLFKGLGDIAMDTVQLQWGWAVVLVGEILVLTAAAITSPENAIDTESTLTEERESSSTRTLAFGFVGIAALVVLALLMFKFDRSSQAPDTAAPAVENQRTAPTELQPQNASGQTAPGDATKEQENAGLPQGLWGKWTIYREIPTSTISCWSETDANNIIGTEIEYGPEIFRWKDTVTEHPSTVTAIIGAEQFHEANSGSGSQVTFQQLGIKNATATEITIKHPDANITGGTTEIPGDVFLVRDPNTIVFSVCNVYFEAKHNADLQ